MKKEQSKQEQIKEAINDVHKAMLENLEISQLVIDTLKRKDLAHYTLLKAKDRLRAIEQEILSEM